MATHLRPLDLRDDTQRKQEKATRAIQEEGERCMKELKANKIFGEVMTRENWRPGHKKLVLNYDRQRAGPNSQSALTARCVFLSEMLIHIVLTHYLLKQHKPHTFGGLWMGIPG